MQNNDNRYQRKARYNPNRETYVDENGNYVYRVLDEEIKDYRCEVIKDGDGGFTPELCAMLDEMDAKEERRLDADDHHENKARYEALDETIHSKQSSRATVEAFPETLGKAELVNKFEAPIGCGLVDFVTVYSKDNVRFTFKNGQEIRA